MMVTVSLLATACGGQGVIDQVLATSTTTTTVAVASDTALFLADIGDELATVLDLSRQLDGDPDPLGSLADIWGDSAVAVSALVPTGATAELKTEWLSIASDYESTLNEYGPSIGDYTPGVSEAAQNGLTASLTQLQLRSAAMNQDLTELTRAELMGRSDDSARYVLDLLDALDTLVPYINQAVVAIQTMSDDPPAAGSRLKTAADALVTGSEDLFLLDPPAQLAAFHERQLEFTRLFAAVIAELADSISSGRDSQDLARRARDLFGRAVDMNADRTRTVSDVLRGPATN